jgi:two-component system sensor histidine kinase VicK
MARHGIGMRWWLAAIFILIAVVTAALVATVSSRQADQAVRANSEDIAVGKTVSAAFAVEQAIARNELSARLPTISGSRDLAVFVFSGDGRLLTADTSNGIRWNVVPVGRAALESALSGRRFVETADAGPTLVALPLRRTELAEAIVAYAPRPAAYSRSLAIFRREVIRAALWTALIAAAAGLLAATLIARRLGRIDAAAAAIERGDFDVQLRPRFRDEVGSLAVSIDRMRRRLRTSFERLRAERDRLERLLEQLHEGVVAVDEELVVQFANTSARRLFGGAALEPGAVLPERWAGVPLRRLARGLFREDAAPAEARADPGDERTIAVVGVPAGVSELAVIVLSDVTAQERRERAEREFVANASHELRTPVSAIASAVEALEAGAQESRDDREAFIRLIGRQADRLARLTRSLLLLARAQTRQEPIRLEPVKLKPLLEEIAAATEPTGARGIEVACADELVALAQRDLAEQVVANLVGNAVKHGRDGEIVLSARATGESVVIEVVDHGPGIGLGAEQRVFDRFYSDQVGQRGGFGLGLAIARDAVRALGGSIEIESEPGHGTTARVILAAGRKT